MGAKEPVEGAHEFHSEFVGQEAFKTLLRLMCPPRNRQIVHVEPNMERLVRGLGRGSFIRRHALEEARIVEYGLNTHVGEDICDQPVPVSQ